MIIQHNISASNTNRMLGTNTKKMETSMEKLNSGCRINKAADDAAGLAISEKMRGQIRGLEQGARNTQDGISLLQTADGGMNEIHGLLQRCRELAVQSANGTYTDGDRNSIQNEVNQLIDEVDRLANQTEFNEQSLLSGKYDKAGNVASSGSLVDYVQYITTTGGVTEKYNYSGTDYASAIVDFSNITSASDVTNLVGNGFNYTCCTCNKAYSVKFVSGSPDTSRLNDSNPVMEVDVSTIANGTDLVNKIIETAYGQAGFVFDPTSTVATGGIPTIGTSVPASATSFVEHYSQLAANGAKLYIYDDRPSEASGSWPSGGSGVFALNVYGEPQQEGEKFFYADIQVGSNAGETVRIFVQNVTAKQLKVDGLLVNPQEKAILAISKVDNAINKVSVSRGIVGSYQNRLEHAINSTQNTAENTQNSESRIRDVDMAKEVMEMTKSSILQQAAGSLLNQANKMPESILNLMKQWGQP